MSIDEMIAVLQAAKAGKQIQIKCYSGEWDNIYEPSWDFSGTEYRVKPEPREWWIHQENTGFYRIIQPWTPASEHKATCHNCIKVREVLE